MARIPKYYEKYGVAIDGIVRCSDCRSICLISEIKKVGSCSCGCKRVREITTLNEEEMARIQSGEIDFPHRDEFLEEFSAHQ